MGASLLHVACDQFLQHLRVERHLSPHTLEAYAHDLKLFCQSVDPDAQRCIQDIAQADVLRWLSKHTAQGYGKSTQARRLAALRTFFAYLGRERLLEHNPTADVDAPRIRRPLPRVPSRDEVRAMIEAVKGDKPMALRDRAILELLYAAGLRASELCTLTISQVNFNMGLVRPMGKGRKERIVPMGVSSQKALREYLEKGRGALVKGVHDVVFVGSRGKPLHRGTLFQLVRDYALRAGTDKRLSPHSMRHAFATHLLAGGADLRVLQEMLGHADISTTEFYTHLETESLHDAILEHHPLGRR